MGVELVDFGRRECRGGGVEMLEDEQRAMSKPGELLTSAVRNVMLGSRTGHAGRAVAELDDLGPWFVVVVGRGRTRGGRWWWEKTDEGLFGEVALNTLIQRPNYRKPEKTNLTVASTRTQHQTTPKSPLHPRAFFARQLVLGNIDNDYEACWQSFSVRGKLLLAKV